MAAFDGQISAQVPALLKQEIAALLESDRRHGTCSEADVIRAAILAGLVQLKRSDPATRLRGYAQIRQGL